MHRFIRWPTVSASGGCGRIVAFAFRSCLDNQIADTHTQMCIFVRPCGHERMCADQIKGEKLIDQCQMRLVCRRKSKPLSVFELYFRIGVCDMQIFKVQKVNK